MRFLGIPHTRPLVLLSGQASLKEVEDKIVTEIAGERVDGEAYGRKQQR